MKKYSVECEESRLTTFSLLSPYLCHTKSYDNKVQIKTKSTKCKTLGAYIPRTNNARLLATARSVAVLPGQFSLLRSSVSRGVIWVLKHPPWPPLACTTRKDSYGKPVVFFPSLGYATKRAWFECVKNGSHVARNEYFCACAYLRTWREHPPFTNPGNAAATYNIIVSRSHTLASVG